MLTYSLPPFLPSFLGQRFQSLVNDVAALGRGIEKIAQRSSFQQDILEQSTVSLLQEHSGILHTVPVSLTHIGWVQEWVCQWVCKCVLM